MAKRIKTGSVPKKPAVNAENDSVSLNEDTSTVINVLANDINVMNGITGFSQPTNGTLVKNANGTFTYTPKANFSGTDTFTYTVSSGESSGRKATLMGGAALVQDGQTGGGAALRSGGYMNVGKDAAPATGPVTVSMWVKMDDLDWGQALVSKGYGMFGSSVDGWRLSTDGYGNSGKLQFKADFAGKDLEITTAANSIKAGTWQHITMSWDGTAKSSGLHIYIDGVEAKYSSKISGSGAYVGSAERELLIGNTSGNTSRFDGLVDNVQVYAQALNKTQAALLAGNQSPGVSAMTLLTLDGNTNDSAAGTGVSTDTATVTIVVNPVNDRPDAVNDSVTMNEDTSVTLSNLKANDTDADGDALTITAVGTAVHGTVVLNANGTVTYTPTANYFGTDSFTYTVSDGKGGTDTATVNLTIRDVPEAPAPNRAPDAVNDAVTMDEDTSVTLTTLKANDTDADGDALTITAVGTAAHGTVVLNANGTITYTPIANYFGTDSFTYTVNDGKGGTDTATVNVTVRDVAEPNRAPDAVNDAVTMDEDTSVILTTLKANDTDADGDTLTISAVGVAAHGSVVLNANGTVTYTPTANYFGTDSFTYTVNDGKGGTDTATVNLTIRDVAEPVPPTSPKPDAINDSITMDEDTSIKINVLANDTGYNGGVAGFTQAAHGTVIKNADGTLTYTPTANYFGTDSFTYTITDGSGLASSGGHNATLQSGATLVADSHVGSGSAALRAGGYINVGKDAAPATGPVTVSMWVKMDDLDWGQTLVSKGYGLFGSSVDGWRLSTDGSGDSGRLLFKADFADSDLEIVTASNVLQAGTWQHITMSWDGTANSSGLRIYINGVETAYTTKTDGSGTYSVDPNRELLIGNTSGNAARFDGLVDDVRVYAQTLVGAQVAQLATGQNPGLPMVTHLTFDGTTNDSAGGPVGQSDTATVNITIRDVAEPAPAPNRVPDAVNDSVTMNEDTSVTLSNLKANDTDADGDTLTISAVGTAAHGSVVLNANGTVTYTPTANYFGADSFTYTVNDGKGGTDTATVNLTIRDVAEPNPNPNPNPGPTPISGTSLAELAASLQAGQWGQLNTLNMDPVFKQGAHTGVITPYSQYAIWDPISHAAYFIGSDHGAPTPPFVKYDELTNTWSQLPTPSWAQGVGTTHGYDHGGIDTTRHEMYFLPFNSRTVQKLNMDTGTWTALPAIPDSVDGYMQVTSGVTWFPEMDSLIVFNTTEISRYDRTTNQWTRLGTIAEDPTYNTFAEYDPVNKVVIFGGGSATPRDLYKLDADGNITRMKDAPTDLGIHMGLVTVDPVTGEFLVLTTNKELYGYNVMSDTWTLKATSSTLPDLWTPYGAATIGDIATPIAEYGVTMFITAGYDNATVWIYKNAEGGGTVPTNPTNHAPVANDDAVLMTEDTSVTLTNLKANDTDADGDALTISSVGTAAHGTVVLNANGTVTYTPTANYAGTDSFSYVIRDGKGGLDSGTVNVTVNGVNDAPKATNDTAATTKNTAKTISVLGNDTDADNDALSIASFTQAAHGTLTKNANNTFTYTPTANYTGSDSFNYTISDGRGGTSTATVSLTVSDVATTPPSGSSDFDLRRTDPNVLRSFGFEASELSTNGGPINWSNASANVGVFVNGTSTGSNLDGHVEIATDEQASGNSSLKFFMPSQSDAGHGGQFYANFSADNSVQFGEGEEFYYQWRQMFSPEFINNVYNYNAWKQSIVGEGDRAGFTASSATQLEIVTNNANGWGSDPHPGVYHSAGGKDGQYQPLFRTLSNGDIDLQYPNNALYSERNNGDVDAAHGFTTYTANEWMTFQVHVKIGTWYENNGVYHKDSLIELWVAREGQPSTLVVSFDEYDIANNSALAEYGKVWLMPYLTGKDPSQVHPDAYTWYDELIISRDRIMDPLSNPTHVGDHGNNTLNGSNGNDLMAGYGGNDLIYGGNGNDVLYGSTGADTFIFKAITEGRDGIMDFDHTEGDKLDLSALLQDYDPVTEAIADFVKVTVSGVMTTVSVDIDGKGSAAGFVAVADLTVGTGPDLTLQKLLDSGSLLT